MPDFSKGHWPKAAIGGLVLVNVVLLVLLAIEQRSRTVAAEAAAAGRPPATLPSPTAARQSPSSAPISTSPEPTISSTASRPSSTMSPSTEQMLPRRLLTVNSATLGWRAVLGHCPTDPEVEVSRDGGRTWRPADSRLRSVSRIRSYNDSAVFAVGGNQKCESRYVTTRGPEESWEANPPLLGQTWYRLPSELNRIHAPGGRLSNPCGERLGDFAGLGVAGAAAVCGDGTVRLTQNGGRRWRELDGVAAGRAVGADEKVYVLAIRSADCPGIGVVLLTPGVHEIRSDSVRCAPGGAGPDRKVAVAVRGKVLWLWAGDEVVVSTDRGRSWERP